MAFSDLASNQMVADSQAATGGFSLNSGQSHTYTGKMMTKDEAVAKYNLDAVYLTSYSGNQLIPKSVMVSCIVSYAHTVRGAYYSSARAWGATGDSTFAVYSSSTNILASDTLYSNAGLTTPLSPPNTHQRWYKDVIGGHSIRISNSGVVQFVKNNTTQVLSDIYADLYVSSNYENPSFQADGDYDFLYEYEDETGWHTIQHDLNPDISTMELEGDYVFIDNIRTDCAIRVTASGSFNKGAQYGVEIGIYTTSVEQVTGEFPFFGFIMYMDFMDWQNEIGVEEIYGNEIWVFGGFVTNNIPANNYLP